MSILVNNYVEKLLLGKRLEFCVVCWNVDLYEVFTVELVVNADILFETVGTFADERTIFELILLYWKGKLDFVLSWFDF